MTPELTILGWTLALALFQIFLHSAFRSHEVGLAHNAGPRDGPEPPMGKVTARLKRAKENLFETLPLFIGAVLVAHIAGRSDGQTLLGAQLYLIARILYVPLYAFGVPYVRSLVWAVSLWGLLQILEAILWPIVF